MWFCIEVRLSFGWNLLLPRKELLTEECYKWWHNIVSYDCPSSHWWVQFSTGTCDIVAVSAKWWLHGPASFLGNGRLLPKCMKGFVLETHRNWNYIMQGYLFIFFQEQEIAELSVNYSFHCWWCSYIYCKRKAVIQKPTWCNQDLFNVFQNIPGIL